MTRKTRERFRSMVTPACALVLAVGAWTFARAPEASPATISKLASQFSFEKEPLNGSAITGSLRTVAPQFSNIRSWISSVGASVALTDLSGAGRSQDVCIVDPRYNSVTLEPAPGTGARYQPIQLVPQGLPYNTVTMAPMGCVPADYNQDGQMDVLVFYWGRSPVLFMRNDLPLTDGAVAFTPRELVSPYQIWNTDAVTLGDLDGAGHVDIVVGNYFPDGARILDPDASGQALVHMNRSLSNATNGGTEHVLMWNSGQGGAQPTASFTEVANPFPAPAMHGWTLALGAQDLTGDGLPDIYIANDFGPDRLLHNVSTPGHLRFVLTHGVRHFTTPKSQVLGNDSFKGMGVAFTDLTLSGEPSILVSNITEPYALEESNFAFVATQKQVFGSGDVANYDNWSEALGLSRSGWGWDIKAGDFDESGRPQILQATGFLAGDTNRWPELQELAMSNDFTMPDPAVWPRFTPGADVSGHDSNPFYVLGPDGRYVNVSKQIGTADTGVSRSLALGDVFHNGHLDYAVANQWRQSYFYLNKSPLQHPYLGLRLVRPASAGGSCAAAAAAAGTTAAIGAEVTVLTGTSGIRIGQIYPANGHGGVSAPELLFALTQNPQSAKIQVRWRDGCGTLHTAITTVADGWHSLLLGNDGSVHEVLPS